MVLEMNAVDDETDNTLKHSSYDCLKVLANKNEYNELEKSRPQIENPGYIENKMKINEMKQNNQRTR